MLHRALMLHHANGGARKFVLSVFKQIKTQVMFYLLSTSSLCRSPLLCSANLIECKECGIIETALLVELGKT